MVKEREEDRMENIEPNQGRELVHRAAKAWMREAEAEAEFELVPLVLIAAEVDEPIELVADRLGDAVQLDDVGMRAVPAEVVRQFLTERAEQTARMEEQFRRLQEAHKPSPVAVGVPAQEGSTPLESLMANDADYVTPRDEFAGRPKPRFLEEELEEGARQLAAAQAEIEARKAARENR
jgi:hypothetical protein